MHHLALYCTYFVQEESVVLSYSGLTPCCMSSRIARVNSRDINIEVHLTKGFPQGGVLSALMWILIADGLLQALNSVGYFA